MSQDLPGRNAAPPDRTSPLWGPSVWERSARLPHCAGAQTAVTALWRDGVARLKATTARLVHQVRRRGDRGDVPGWVLVTLMTAGLVLVLWGIARDRLTEVFNHAIDSVLGGG